MTTSKPRPPVRVTSGTVDSQRRRSLRKLHQLTAVAIFSLNDQFANELLQQIEKLSDTEGQLDLMALSKLQKWVDTNHPRHVIRLTRLLANARQSGLRLAFANLGVLHNRYFRRTPKSADDTEQLPEE